MIPFYLRVRPQPPHPSPPNTHTIPFVNSWCLSRLTPVFVLGSRCLTLTMPESGPAGSWFFAELSTQAWRPHTTNQPNTEPWEKEFVVESRNPRKSGGRSSSIVIALASFMNNHRSTFDFFSGQQIYPGQQFSECRSKTLQRIFLRKQNNINASRHAVEWLSTQASLNPFQQKINC